MESKYAGLSKKERRAIVQKAIKDHNKDRVAHDLTSQAVARGFDSLYAWRDRALAYADVEAAMILSKMIEHKLNASKKN